MYVILWRFQVKPGYEVEFERAYGPAGDWARFFRRGAGYRGTELLRESGEHLGYLTIDRWSSQAAYAAFRERWRDEYRALDERFECLTERETALGSFSSVLATTPE
jgi:heme-degrading monooxygenase HmoA